MAEIPLDIQIAAVKREIALRQRCYPRWVEKKLMKQAAADHEIAWMSAVLHTLIALKECNARGNCHCFEEPSHA